MRPHSPHPALPIALLAPLLHTTLSLTGCGHAEDPTFYDQTYSLSFFNGTSGGSPPAGVCNMYGGPAEVYVRFSEDGTLSTLGIGNWSYICGSESDADQQEQWRDVLVFCKTMTYSLGDWVEADAVGDEQYRTADLILEDMNYLIDEAIVEDEEHTYALRIDEAGALSSIAGDPTDYGTAYEDDEPDWDNTGCVPEDFSTTDLNDYAPALGTGEPYEEGR